MGDLLKASELATANPTEGDADQNYIEYQPTQRQLNRIATPLEVIPERATFGFMNLAATSAEPPTRPFVSALRPEPLNPFTQDSGVKSPIVIMRGSRKYSAIESI